MGRGPESELTESVLMRAARMAAAPGPSLDMPSVLPRRLTRSAMPPMLIILRVVSWTQRGTAWCGQHGGHGRDAEFSMEKSGMKCAVLANTRRWAPGQ